MKFFNIDQHISVIRDIKDQFAALGHQVDDLCLSGHHWVMKRAKDSVPGLDGDQWCGFVERKFWNEFYDQWHERLDKYDGFICTYPPIFSYLYRRFNKPVIVDIPIRYEYPCQSDADAWRGFTQYLRDGVDDGRIFLVANNPYDREYTELFVNRTVRFIPSVCEYAGCRWRPEFENCIYYCWDEIPELNNGILIQKAKALRPGHDWADLCKAKAIVHFPYNVSTMSIMEQYTMGIPLLFPTQDFLMRLYKEKRCRVLEQSSWAATFGRPAGSVVGPASDRWGPNGDPNDYADYDAVSAWLRFADFYSQESMQGLTYFDSFEELRAISRRPLDWFKARAWDQNEFLIKRKERARGGWVSLLEEVKLCQTK